MYYKYVKEILFYLYLFSNCTYINMFRSIRLNLKTFEYISHIFFYNYKTLFYNSVTFFFANNY